MSRDVNFDKFFKVRMMGKYLTSRIQQDLSKFPPNPTFVQKCLDTVLEQKSIYLYGNVRVGKTLAASDCLMKFLRYSYVNKLDKKVKFISFPELIMEFKSTFDSKDKNESTILDEYCSYDLLVLDEFGLMVMSDWLFNLLYILINKRYEDMKPTIYTSNISLRKMMGKINDERIPRRIMDSCGIIKEM